MVILIGGRKVVPVPVYVELVTTSDWRADVLRWMDKVQAGIKSMLPPPGAVMAAAPVGGLTGKLWPLVDRLQEFGLAAAIAVSLWGLCRVIMGDPSGKQQIWQAIIGFTGLFIIPEVFFSIWEAFK